MIFGKCTELMQTDTLGRRYHMRRVEKVDSRRVQQQNNGPEMEDVNRSLTNLRRSLQSLHDEIQEAKHRNVSQLRSHTFALVSMFFL